MTPKRTQPNAGVTRVRAPRVAPPPSDPATVAVRSLAKELGLKEPHDAMGWEESNGRPALLSAAMAAYEKPPSSRTELEGTLLYSLILHSFNEALTTTTRDGSPPPITLDRFLSFVRRHPEQNHVVMLFSQDPLASDLHAALKR